jgi:uncharacterized protein YlxW (UPF0749 family)
MANKKTATEKMAVDTEEVTAPRPQVWNSILEDILSNALDPGYGAVSAGTAKRHWWDGPIAWIGCLVVGLVLATAYQQSHRSAPARDLARHDLLSRIRSIESAGQSMDNTAKKLASEVAALRDSQLAGVGNPAQLRSLEIASGSMAVTGPGMVVQLSEPVAQESQANGRPGSTPQNKVAVLHDRDIRRVVNELWRSGAEAISVNGLRLTATSAIRFAGESVLVDFQPINAPYSIEAVGDRDKLQVAFADSAAARQLKTKEAVDGISFRFSGKSDLKLSSVTVAEPRYARQGASTKPPTRPNSPTISESPR